MIFNRHTMTTVRELTHLTKSELAAAAGKSPAYITELEKGDKTAPSMPALRDLAEALGVDVRALYVAPTVEQLVNELLERLNGDTAALDGVISRLSVERSRLVAAQVA